jgi:hypothetical protein
LKQILREFLFSVGDLGPQNVFAPHCKVFADGVLGKVWDFDKFVKEFVLANPLLEGCEFSVALRIKFGDALVHIALTKTMKEIRFTAYKKE